MTHWGRSFWGRLFPLWFALSLFSLQNGYAEQTGRIIGKVVDEEAKVPLPGATIDVVGTLIGTATNLSGDFSLVLPSTFEGKQEIKISYLGFETQTVEVDVKSGETVTLNVIMKSKLLQTGEVVVTGQLEGQAKALNQQRASETIKNIVAADQISRFPDPNAAEALQRIPGVNIERDEGEGRYVFVRGLSPQYTNVSINGEQIPSPEGDVRYIALDAVPADQLASLEVTKALTPDMDGDAIGGNVNLITRTAQSDVLKVNASLAGEYNDLVSKFGYQSSVNLGQRLNDGKFGYMFNLSYHPSHRGSQKNEMDDWALDNDEGLPELQTFELRDYDIERNRVGLSSTFDYRFDDNNMIYLRALYSDLREHENRRRVEFSYDEDDDEWTINKNMKSRPENQGVYSFNLGGTHASNNFNLDYEASYAYARQETPHDRQLYFEVSGLDIDLDVDDALVPKITSVKDEDGNTFCYCSETDAFEFDKYEESETMATDQNITGKVNMAYPFQFGKTPGKLKFGGKVRFKDKDYEYKYYNEWKLKDGIDDLTLSQFLGEYESDDFANGDYKTGKFPDVASFRRYLLAHPDYFENDEEAALEEKTLSEYDASENVYAGYVMSEFQFNKLMLLAGVRYEYTDVEYDAGEWDAENDAAVKVSGTNNYGLVLPMVHLKYNLNDFSILRAAATYSYARPNFGDMVQGAEFDLDDKEAELGNLDLEPVKSFNLDLFGEHYIGSVGVISAGFFYKSLSDFIYKKTYDGTFRGVEDVEITQSVNGDDATLWGLEVAWQQNLTFLPGVLSGLGVYANYTYTNSSATVKNLAGTDEAETEIDLPGQSKHVGNLALYYTRGGFNARVSANFNGEFISEIDGDDLYKIDDRLQIDVSASQRLSDNVSVYGEVINLTNERRVDFYNTLDTPATREYYGFWARLGFKYSL
ncbi:TonB-dependent receptor [Chloroherpeton thalassium ATCC 35110]|uniref:TonB-dependent receptor n=1 Tax=Chloroherpeton thalassium (strain ATCC 35110 / GB-78) TaxID=517418 RepID=B3QZ53_CHLT3|nr:TonB-dependent receptor [Chloroherpeton thalassium]ACF13746.1 TonB-dependent receptor [Chloroherpeton thalassium ATCC 35110]